MSTQNEPVESGHDDASDNDKLDGLIEQMRADVSQGHVDDTAAVLRERLAEADINVTLAEFDRILDEIG